MVPPSPALPFNFHPSPSYLHLPIGGIFRRVDPPPPPLEMRSWLLLLALSAGITIYSYALYPALLWLVSRVRRRHGVRATDLAEWPRVTITLPAYNAQDTLRPVLDGLVRADYPADRRQILVVSDGSTDGTDDLVREYAAQGVELLRIEGRLGKTEIENRAFDSIRTSSPPASG